MSEGEALFMQNQKRLGLVKQLTDRGPVTKKVGFAKTSNNKTTDEYGGLKKRTMS